MLSKTDFIEAIKRDVFPELEQNDKTRKMLIGGLILLILVFGGIIYTKGLTDDGLQMIPVSLIVTGIYAWLVGVFYVGNLKNKYMPMLLKLFQAEYKDINAETEDTDEHDMNICEKSLALPYFDCMNREEQIVFQTHSTRFSLSNISLSYGIGKESNTFFEGWFIQLSNPKKINGYALFFSRSPLYKIVGLNPIKLLNETSLKYQLFSDNEAEARQIFNPFIVEKINEFKKRLNLNWMGISYFGNHILLSFKGSHRLFNPFFSFSSFTNTKRFEDFYEQMRCLFELIEGLNVQNMDYEVQKCEFNQKLYAQVSKYNKKYKKGRSDYIFFTLAILIPLSLIVLMVVLQN